MDSLISISSMAKLHCLSRQTLIHYDHIGLFKPVEVDEKGYRYYSRSQIPFLRKIVFLKSLGLSLETIKEQLSHTNPKEILTFFIDYKSKINQQIAELNHIREALNQQISILNDAVDGYEMKLAEPFIKYYPERKAIYQEFPDNVTKEKLHLTLMNLWRQLESLQIRPSAGFGTILTPCFVNTFMDASRGVVSISNIKLKGGSCIFVPPNIENLDNLITIPAGEYVCFYKSGMPYDMKYAQYLLQWMQKNGYELTGNIIDVCLIDTTYYQQNRTEDYCLLQVPFKRK